MLFRSEMSKTGTKKLTLPDEVDGVKLSWSQEKSNTAAKIAMLEVVVIVLLVLEKKEKKKTAQKDRNIQLQLEYPEIVSKMAVLMGSGMTVEQAWNRITSRYLDERKNNDKNIMPAYEEMLVTEREISDGVTGRKAYAGFAERVKLPCYQKLVRIILQSIHKGSKGVCEMLEKESEDAFDERRLLALKLGEEAGTKMLMPMMIMMAIVTQCPLCLHSSRCICILHNHMPSDPFHTLVLFTKAVVYLFFCLCKQLIRLFIRRLLLPNLQLIAVILIESIRI